MRPEGVIQKRGSRGRTSLTFEKLQTRVLKASLSLTDDSARQGGAQSGPSTVDANQNASDKVTIYTNAKSIGRKSRQQAT